MKDLPHEADKAYYAWIHIRDRQDEITPSGESTWLEWYKAKFAGQLGAVRGRLREGS